MTDHVCKGCYGDSLPGEHLFDCPTRIREIEAKCQKMEKALKTISAQKTGDELGAEEYENADFEGGYNAIIEMAREAIKP